MGSPLVLVVDDHPGFRRIARRILEGGGFVVEEAATGSDAIAAARALSPSVILLDVQLPDSDGFSITEALLAAADAPPVVLTSSRDAEDFGDRIAASGAVGFLPKATLSAASLHGLIARR